MAFAIWLVAVLLRMPRPPVPPSLAVTLIAPVVTAIGFALGMRVAVRLRKDHQCGFLEAFVWALAGATIGTLAMFPFGGMMAGFGLFGLAIVALLIREAVSQRYSTIGRGHA
jgi:hypothetical protein